MGGIGGKSLGGLLKEHKREVIRDAKEGGQIRLLERGGDIFR